jgi:agmatinase
MQDFDPNAPGSADSGIFGLPYTERDSKLVYLPVPWEATTSYGGGTSLGPRAIFEASKQVDLYDLDVLKPYEAGLYMLPESEDVIAWNGRAKSDAQKIIRAGGLVGNDPELMAALGSVNTISERLNDYVYRETKRLLAKEHIVGVVGGDHSVPLGAMMAVAERFGSFGVLHFDAHSDTREAYEGFTYSHASIMHNVLERLGRVERLVQVGIRDVSGSEMEYVESQGARVKVFTDRDLAGRRFDGVPFRDTARAIVDSLPDNVWVSFDIDGLDPRFCPNTGTPVPGGLDFNEANFILGTIVKTGRKILGFDLNEVAPSSDGGDEWDANVGARVLYKLTGWTLASQAAARLRG